MSYWGSHLFLADCLKKVDYLAKPWYIQLEEIAKRGEQISFERQIHITIPMTLSETIAYMCLRRKQIPHHAIQNIIRIARRAFWDDIFSQIEPAAPSV